eukprot:CAMPEP_0179271304 /NCGR_PEP_ID=MMETSP0797-20121207/31910_1 /TAXON_ID=47934 /ORGANISM="Dinophysis acuminata, Strain DAEP01" /LENGTH=81 /DNA_ID=CAMNT_0020979659 /DNA_START=236 /DNA_END=478 /DNA_ORIENTATION=-
MAAAVFAPMPCRAVMSRRSAEGHEVHREPAVHRQGRVAVARPVQPLAEEVARELVLGAGGLARVPRQAHPVPGPERQVPQG